MNRLRIYVDSSVIGGCLDEEFSEDSKGIIDMAIAGRAILLVSDMLIQEISLAPEPVRAVLESLPTNSLEKVERSQEADELLREYLNAKVLGEASWQDALHVAIASVEGADMIASWNFRHIVHYDKIRGFMAVNLRQGYPLIGIHSPKEVV